MLYTWCKRLLLFLALSGACAAQITNPKGGGGSGTLTNAAASLPANQVLVGNGYPDTLTTNCTIGVVATDAEYCPGGFFGALQAADATPVAHEVMKWTGGAWVLATTGDVSDPSLTIANANAASSLVRPESPGSQISAVSADAVTEGHFALLKGSGGAGNNGLLTDSATCTAGQRTFGTWAVSAASGTRLLNYNPAMCSPAAGLLDPGGNGFVDRTALNTTSARTLTGSGTVPATRITITNGGGGGNPVFDVGTDIARRSVNLRRGNFTASGESSNYYNTYGDILGQTSASRTATAADANNGATVIFTATAATNTGISSGEKSLRTGRALYTAVRLAIGATTPVRSHIGIFASNSPTNIVATDKLAFAGAFFHYCNDGAGTNCKDPTDGTTNEDDTNFQCVLTTGAAWTKADSTVAPSTTDTQFLEVYEDGSQNYHFYINGAEVCAAISQSNKPAAGTNMMWAARILDTGGGAATIKIEAATWESTR